MVLVNLTGEQASVLRRAAQDSVEWTEEQFRSGAWEHWTDEDARGHYAEMAILLECLDILLPALPAWTPLTTTEGGE